MKRPFGWSWDDNKHILIIKGYDYKHNSQTIAKYPTINISKPTIFETLSKIGNSMTVSIEGIAHKLSAIDWGKLKDIDISSNAE